MKDVLEGEMKDVLEGEMDVLKGEMKHEMEGEIKNELEQIGGLMDAYVDEWDVGVLYLD